MNQALEEMLSEQIIARGVRNKRVCDAFRQVPRHLFVPKHLQADAYNDFPLPIGEGQTISQPYMVAYMLDALELTGSERLLEIGTGSGFQTALLANLAKHGVGFRELTVDALTLYQIAGVVPHRLDPTSRIAFANSHQAFTSSV